MQLQHHTSHACNGRASPQDMCHADLPCAAGRCTWCSLLACSVLAVASTCCFLVTAEPDLSRSAHGVDFLEVNAGNYAAVAATVASEQRQILVTTVDVEWRGGSAASYVLDTFQNFAYSLAQVGRLRNTLTLAYGKQTCELLIGAGIPCFVDRAGPQKDELPGIHKSSAPTFQKYWHALELLRFNYSVLVLDSDLTVVQDPFQFHNAMLDVEGLSDWNGLAQVPGPEQYLQEGCHLYRMVQQTANSNASMGTVWYPKDRKPYASVKHLSPCISTGLFFLEPRPATVAFLKHMVEHMLKHIWAWEQSAFNEVIMAHVFGSEDRLPLTLRVLPTRHFLNVKVAKLRRQQGLDLDIVVIHAGGVGGQGKSQHLKWESSWFSDKWQPDMGLPILGDYGEALSG